MDRINKGQTNFSDPRNAGEPQHDTQGLSFSKSWAVDETSAMTWFAMGTHDGIANECQFGCDGNEPGSSL